jgi:urease accessory protein
MTWHARLQLDYTVEAERCVLRHQHSGPLRILQSLYPEGDAVCHNVLVHPPGGLVGGDTLDITATVGPGAHGLLTTPGATRFYRSAGERALQRTELTLADGARLEWLPLEALCYDACQAENRLTMHLAPAPACSAGTSPRWACPAPACRLPAGSSSSTSKCPACGWSAA